MTAFGQANYLSISPSIQVSSASYPEWDGKWVSAKVQWCSVAGNKGSMAHSTCG